MQVRCECRVCKCGRGIAGCGGGRVKKTTTVKTRPMIRLIAFRKFRPDLTGAKESAKCGGSSNIAFIQSLKSPRSVAALQILLTSSLSPNRSCYNTAGYWPFYTIDSAQQPGTCVLGAQGLGAPQCLLTLYCKNMNSYSRSIAQQ